MRLLYAVDGKKGAAMLTGGIGCGKTLLSRVLLQGLIDRRFKVALISNPSLSPVSFLREILYQLGIKTTFKLKKIDLLHLLNNEILNNLKNGKDTILVIDEAHFIIGNKAISEEIRLLLNFQLDDRFLLTLILIGQPELKDGISEIPQLEQRIAIRYNLKPLNLSETEAYIQFRLKTAGLSKNIFTQEAISKIYEYSKGTPRKINNICDLSLLVGYSMKVKEIDSKVVQGSINEQS
ncbi:MAG: AAA family ATPase [Desulfobacterales bacterium]|nr:AAA family ATPase [Desulfobacterales bacterium]